MYDNVRVVGDKMMVEICEAQEGLYFLNFLRFGPILDDLNFRGIHLQSVFGEDKSKIVDSVFVKMTFLWLAI